MIIVAYSSFQQPFIVICEFVAYSPFQQPFIVMQDHCGLFSFFSTAIHCYIGSLWLIFLQNSHSLLYRIIVAYFRFQHPFIVICELVPYSPFHQPFIVIQDHFGLFSFFSTAIHCYIGSLWLIFLQNSHSLLYGIIVAYSPLEQPFIVLCEVVAYSPFQQPLIVIQDNCGLFSFRTATHCYMGSLWLILLQNSHSLLHRIIVAYFPLEQPLVVIWDHCGLFSFRTAIHCYMRRCGLFSFSTALHCYIGSLWIILLFFNSHSLLYRIIVAYFPLEQSLIVIQDNCGLFSFSTSIYCYMRTCALFSFSPAIYC